MPLEDEGGAARPPRRPEPWLARRGGWIEALRVPAALYRLATGCRNELYDRGWLASWRLEAPVVSVGNLSAGGTGKTPFVAWLVARLDERGWRPGILSRGYRAGARGAEGENDEIRLLKRLAPHATFVADPDRVAGGRLLVERGADVVVLDDGFQHRRLRRDLDLVLVDATRPWGLPRTGTDPGVRALLPRGLLRESPRRLARADALVVTRADQVAPEELAALLAELQGLAPAPALLRGVHRPSRLVSPEGRSSHASALRGQEVDLVSGIGNPEAFEATVRKLGARMRAHRRFRDHHDYAPGDLDGLGGDGRWIVTTAKDAVKLETLGRRVHVLEVEFQVSEGAGVLEALLDALPGGRARRERAALHEGLHG